MIKKLMLLAVSVAALVAFAVPAAANAADFTHNGEFIESHVQVNYTGTVNFETHGSGGVHCDVVHATVTLEVGGMGTLTGYQATECKTTPGGAPVHAKAENLPWTVDALPGNKAEITNIKIHNSVRHPLNTELQIATNTITGSVLIAFGAGGSGVLSNGAGGVFVNTVTPLTVTGTVSAAGGTEVGSE